jgi:hypothetical protein
MRQVREKDVFHRYIRADAEWTFPGSYDETSYLTDEIASVLASALAQVNERTDRARDALHSILLCDSGDEKAGVAQL